MNDNIILTKELYDELSEMAAKYLALLQAGVEEWRGYDDAMTFFNPLTYKEEE
jgi:hypothetical protein